MLGNIMLNKTIKAVFTICTVVLFLSACSSTSTEDTKASSSNGSGSAVANSSSNNSASSSSSSSSIASPASNLFFFDFDSAALRADSRAVLNQHAAVLRANPRAVRLEGHADERGTREYNIALGERRAQAVRIYLRSQGVNSPVEVVSYGEERPVVDTSNEYGWQQNRRVEIK